MDEIMYMEDTGMGGWGGKNGNDNRMNEWREIWMKQMNSTKL